MMGTIRGANSNPMVNGALAVVAITPVGSGVGLALTLLKIVDDFSTGKGLSWKNLLALPLFAIGLFWPGAGAAGGLLRLADSLDPSGQSGPTSGGSSASVSSRPRPPAKKAESDPPPPDEQMRRDRAARSKSTDFKSPEEE